MVNFVIDNQIFNIYKTCYAGLAQLVEQRFCKPRAGSSSLSAGTIQVPDFSGILFFYIRFRTSSETLTKNHDFAGISFSSIFSFLFSF